MVAVTKAIDHMHETLHELTTLEALFEILLGLVHSEERHENRLKALYLIGKMATALGTVKENGFIMYKMFTQLTKIALGIPHSNSVDNSANTKGISIKVYLYHALGKIAKNFNSNYDYDKLQHLLAYLLHEEFDRISKRPESMEYHYVAHTLLLVLTNDVSFVNFFWFIALEAMQVKFTKPKLVLSL